MSHTVQTCVEFADRITRLYGIPIKVQKDPGGLVYIKIEGSEQGYLNSPWMGDAYLMGIFDLAAFLKPAKREGDLP